MFIIFQYLKFNFTNMKNLQTPPLSRTFTKLTFWVMCSVLFTGHHILAQILVTTSRATYTAQTANGTMYNWSQFPTFTAPIGKKVIFAGSGRLSLVANANDYSISVSGSAALTPTFLFSHGFTHLNHNQMTFAERGNPSNWYSGGLTKNQRACFVSLGEWKSWTTVDRTSPTRSLSRIASVDSLQLKWVALIQENGINKEDPFSDYYESSTTTSNMLWGIKSMPGYTIPGGTLYKGPYPNGFATQKGSYDLICWDIETGNIASDAPINNDLLFSNSPGLNWTLAEYQQAAVNRYVYLIRQTKAQASSTMIGSFCVGTPYISYGTIKRSDYLATGPNTFLWNQTANNALDVSKYHRNMPSIFNGMSLSTSVDYHTPSAYYQFSEEFDKNKAHYIDVSGDIASAPNNWLANLIGTQELGAKFSSLPRIPVYWLYKERVADNDKAVPANVAEAIAIFPWFTNLGGIIFWDEDGVGLNNARTYGVYEHFMHGLWRLFANHKDMLEGNPIYLQKDTEFKVNSISNGNLNTIDANKIGLWTSQIDPTNKADANMMKVNKLPFVRAIVKGCDILVAACYPYADANTQTQVSIKYNGWTSTITLNGDEVYLGRATMSPPIGGTYQVGNVIQNITSTITPIAPTPVNGVVPTINVNVPSGYAPYQWVVTSRTGTATNAFSGSNANFAVPGGSSINASCTYTNFCGSVTLNFACYNYIYYRMVAFPNPTNKNLTISANVLSASEIPTDGAEKKLSSGEKTLKTLDINNIEAKLLDEKGKVIYAGKFNKESLDIDTSRLVNGTYFLHIAEGNELIIKQIIIQH